MELRLLKEDYRNDSRVYEAFIKDELTPRKNHSLFSDEIITLPDIEPFPIYMGKGSESEKKIQFNKAFKVIERDYIHLDRDLIMDPRFWHSLFSTEFAPYIKTLYPDVLKSENAFRNILFKKFDWENYIYKSILAVQYIFDNTNDHKRDHYYTMIIDNLDFYNYIIKYRIFRNDEFLINVLDIIDNNDISETLKRKLKPRSNLGDDERFGRRVIFELNKIYPVVMFPMLSYDELEKHFLDYLKIYTDLNQ